MRDRITLLIAIVLLAGVTATSYWYATVLRKPTAAATARPGSPDFTAEQLVITQFDPEGRARHRLFAATLQHYADTDDVEATRPRLVSLRPDQPRVEVRALRARIENAGERVHLFDDVVVLREPGKDAPPMRVESNYLLALPDVDRYSTDRPVAVLRGDTRIEAGGGMQLDNIARTARFSGGVKMRLPPAPSAQ